MRFGPPLRAPLRAPSRRRRMAFGETPCQRLCACEKLDRSEKPRRSATADTLRPPSRNSSRARLRRRVSSNRRNELPSSCRRRLSVRSLVFRWRAIALRSGWRTPDYPIGCKRLLLSSDYLLAIARPNVELITDGIRRVTANGIETVDGRLHAPGAHSVTGRPGAAALDCGRRSRQPCAHHWRAQGSRAAPRPASKENGTA